MAGEKTSLSQTMSTVPNLPWAALGFGCYMAAVESGRMPVMQTVIPQVGSEIWVQPISFVALVLLAVFYTRHSERNFSVASIVITGLFMVVGVVLTNQATLIQANSFGTVVLVGSLVLNMTAGLLFFYWVVTIYRQTARATVLVLATGTLVCGTISALVAVLKTSVAEGAVILLPLISVICLCYYRDAEAHKLAHVTIDERTFVSLSDGGTAMSGFDDTKTFRTDSRSPSTQFMYFCMLMGLLISSAVAFGQIHYTWINTQDGEIQALAIQAGIATGTLVAGLLILAFVRFFWNRSGVTLYTLITVPLILAALWLSAVINGGWVFSYLVLLNVAQKLTNLFIVIAPFIVAPQKSRIGIWWFAYLAFEAGKVLSGLCAPLAYTPIGNIVSGCSVAMLIVCGFGMAVIDLSGKTAADRSVLAEGSNSSPDPLGGYSAPGEVTNVASTTEAFASNSSGAVPEITSQGQQWYSRACHVVADRYQLTNREEQVLELLGRGRTAQHIASAMVISPTTAKTHLRNIYAKMNIHTQQEAISAIESEIEMLKSDANA